MWCWDFIRDNSMGMWVTGLALEQMISATDTEELVTESSNGNACPLRKQSLWNRVVQDDPRLWILLTEKLISRTVTNSSNRMQKKEMLKFGCFLMAIVCGHCIVCGRQWVCLFTPEILVFSHLGIHLSPGFGSWMLANGLARGSQTPGQGPGRLQEIILGAGSYQKVLLLIMLIVTMEHVPC